MTPDPILLEMGEYPSIRLAYHNAVFSAILGYMVDPPNVRITAYKSEMQQAMIEALPKTAETAWLDGGSELPLDEDANTLLDSFQASELANIDQMFLGVKARKKEGDTAADMEASARADGYADGLDALYNQIKTMAAGNQMLTFAGTDGSPKSVCQSIGGMCVKLMGQRHRASWWKSHDLIPYRGNKNFECGGWNCQHYLENDKGEMFTV